MKMVEKGLSPKSHRLLLLSRLISLPTRIKQNEKSRRRKIANNTPLLLLLLLLLLLGSGCGSVGRAVASNNRGLRFEKTKIKEKEAGIGSRAVSFESVKMFIRRSEANLIKTLQS